MSLSFVGLKEVTWAPLPPATSENIEKNTQEESSNPQVQGVTPHTHAGNCTEGHVGIFTHACIHV